MASAFAVGVVKAFVSPVAGVDEFDAKELHEDITRVITIEVNIRIAFMRIRLGSKFTAWEQCYVSTVHSLF